MSVKHLLLIAFLALTAACSSNEVVDENLSESQLYQQAQVIFKDQAPWATIGHSVVFQPVRKEVVDFRIDPFGGNIFYGVDLK